MSFFLDKGRFSVTDLLDKGRFSVTDVATWEDGTPNSWSSYAAYVPSTGVLVSATMILDSGVYFSVSVSGFKQGDKVHVVGLPPSTIRPDDRREKYLRERWNDGL